MWKPFPLTRAPILSLYLDSFSASDISAWSLGSPSFQLPGRVKHVSLFYRQAGPFPALHHPRWSALWPRLLTITPLFFSKLTLRHSFRTSYPVFSITNKLPGLVQRSTWPWEMLSQYLVDTFLQPPQSYSLLAFWYCFPKNQPLHNLSTTLLN